MALGFLFFLPLYAIGDLFCCEAAIFVDFSIWVVEVAQFLHLGRSGLGFSHFSKISCDFGVIFEVKFHPSCCCHDA